MPNSSSARSRCHAICLLSAISLCQFAVAGTLDGVWRSRGYGTVIDIEHQRAQIYDLNSFVCLKRKATEPVDGHLFRDPRLSANGRLLTTTSAEAFTTIDYDRLERLPALCTGPSTHDPQDPLFNFDAFLSWFEDDYAFSARRAVDWPAIRARYRPKITARTSEAQLLDIFKQILRQLQDMHVALSSDTFYVNSGTPALFDQWFKEYYANAAQRRPPLDKFAKSKAKDYMHRAWIRYLDAGSLDEVSDNIVTGKALGGRIAYLAVLGESGYSAGEDLLADQVAAGRELEGAMNALGTPQGLILDMRINFGGDDGIGLMLAGLLTMEDRPGLAKCTRDGGNFTPIQRTTVHHARNAFKGPIVILSSPYNVSAGENLMMMVKDYPNVLIVGDRSAGVHSDTLDKRLPNGWKISISNEAFVAPDGTMYETLGVPPDVLVPYYPEIVRTTGVDPLLEKALHILSGPNTKVIMAAAKRVTRGTPSVCH